MSHSTPLETANLNEDSLTVTEKLKLSELVKQLDSDNLCKLVLFIYDESKKNEGRKNCLEDAEEKLMIRLDVIDRQIYNQLIK